jgi:hypothetical protein
MKKGLILLFVALSLSFAVVAFADKDLPVFKAGESVYVCGCGEGCDCLTMSRKAGNCSCGKPLVKGVVSKVDEGKAFVKIDGKDRAFSTKAKYACACGEGCKCGTISQKQGKCGCGSKLKEVK